jgi:hypothetical protein
MILRRIITKSLVGREVLVDPPAPLDREYPIEVVDATAFDEVKTVLLNLVESMEYGTKIDWDIWYKRMFEARVVLKKYG